MQNASLINFKAVKKLSPIPAKNTKLVMCSSIFLKISCTVALNSHLLVKSTKLLIFFSFFFSLLVTFYLV